MALYTSKKNIIKIEVFMENFLGISYDGKEKLTHNVMRQFLLEKGHPCPRRARFSNIENRNILNGEILIVKDKSGKKIGYYNPGKDLASLLEELREGKNLIQSENIRRKILKENNYLLLNDGTIIEKEDDLEEYGERTRDKKFVFVRRNRVVLKRRR